MSTTFTHGHSGYTNHKCRCAVCKKAHSDWSKVYNRATRLAGTRYRQQNPEAFAALLAESYEHYGIEQHPVGRPAGEWSMDSEPTTLAASVRRLLAGAA